jgi:hypothetical protein
MEELDRAIMKHYLVKKTTETPFSFPKDPESVLKQLLFILNHLMERGYTLSVICLSDFVFRDNVLFLKKESRLVEMDKGPYFTEAKKKDKCFIPEGKDSLTMTYASVGLFAFYLWTHKIKTTLTEADYGKLKGTKVYYFIKNTLEKNPILLYL